MRMLAFGEQVDAIEFAMTLLPTPDGLMPVGTCTSLSRVHCSAPCSSISMSCWTSRCWRHRMPSMGRVRQSLDSIRSRKAAILANSNGHFEAGGRP